MSLSEVEEMLKIEIELAIEAVQEAGRRQVSQLVYLLLFLVILMGKLMKWPRKVRDSCFMDN